MASQAVEQAVDVDMSSSFGSLQTEQMEYFGKQKMKGAYLYLSRFGLE